MRSKLMLVTLGAVGLVTGCTQTGTVICTATVLDATGAVVGTATANAVIEVKSDSVVTNPKPCNVTTQVNGATVINGTDSVIPTSKP